MACAVQQSACFDLTLSACKYCTCGADSFSALPSTENAVESSNFPTGIAGSRKGLRMHPAYSALQIRFPSFLHPARILFRSYYLDKLRLPILPNLHFPLLTHLLQLPHDLQLRQPVLALHPQHTRRVRMVPLGPVLQIHEVATLAVYQLAVTRAVGHEERDRARWHVGGLIVSFADGGKDRGVEDTGVCPGGRDGVDANGEVGVQVARESTHEAEDGVFGSCWGGVSRQVACIERDEGKV